MRWTPAFLILFVTVVIGSCSLDRSTRQEASGARIEHASNTDASATPTPLCSMRPDSPLVTPVDERTIYTSESGGYSLEVPVGWVVEEESDYSGAIKIVPPARKPVDTIYVSYLKYEKPVDDDLFDWYHRYFDIVESDINYYYSCMSTAITDATGSDERNAVFKYIADRPYGRSYIVANGPLVLELYSNGANSEQLGRLRRIAASIRPVDGGPTSILQVSDPKNTPSVRTLDEYDERERITREATAAINIRRQTGETPYDLLTDPEVAAAYEHVIELMIEYRIPEEQRNEITAQLTAEPRPTVDSYSIYEYLVAEYDKRLPAIQETSSAQVAKEMTRQATIALTPMPTSTVVPVPNQVLTDGSEQHVGFEPILAVKRDGPVGDAMLVWYDPVIWKLDEGRNGSFLTSRDFRECKLYLYDTRIEGIPIAAEWLADREWIVYYYDTRRIRFAVDGQRDLFHTGLLFPADQQYSETDKGICQRLAEDVLNTASVVSAKLLDAPLE